MRVSRLLTVILSVFALDQATKFLVLEELDEAIAREVIPNFFNLTLVFNRGAAFGMFSALPDSFRKIVLLIVSLIAVGVVIVLLVRDARGDAWSQFALALILGGAAGNAVDRVRFDAVVDFLDFYVTDYHWPAFNIADSAISLGVMILLLRMVVPQKSSEPVAAQVTQT